MARQNCARGVFVFKKTAPSANIAWQLSSRCDSGQCVGVARQGESVLIANTNNLEGSASEFTLDEWRQFIAGVKLGDFDGIA
jgi:hypothetical protein